MGNFFAELKRRHIYRVGAAYAVVAWVLLQLVNNLAPALKLPDWSLTLVVVFLAIGFPIALIFAWIAQLSASEGVKTATGNIDWFLAAALIAVLAAVSYEQLAPSAGTPSAPLTSAAPAAQTQGLAVAVLPFVNLSDDRAQEFFSDGMTEEITSALAKVPNLRVVGRTSAFQFKGQNKDLTAIGQALHATHLIEGSVRKDGNEVRITAQLIKASDGTHLWTESYNRELKGVFAIQEEIATAIAASLSVPLGLRQSETLVSSRTEDTASYQDYLRAKALFRLRALPDVTALLEKVVERDPTYAPAWALLSLAHELTPIFHPAFLSGDVAGTRRVLETVLPRAETAARRAIALDAKLADGYEALALVEAQRGKLLEAEELYLKALTLDPNNPDTLSQFSQSLAEVGRLDEALAMRERLQTLEPLVPIYNASTAGLLSITGRNDAAITMLRNLPPDFMYGKLYLSMAYASAGRYSDAATTLSEIPAQSLPTGTVAQAVRLLRSAPAAAATPRNLPRLGILEFVYLHVGAASRLLEYEEGNIEAGGYIPPFRVWNVWHPSYAPVRKTDRFKNLLRKAGVVDYWRAKGWPELCHPTTGDDFDCA